MKIGLMFASSAYTTAEECAAVAEVAEEVGLESLWAVEHVFVPQVIRTPYPYTADGELAGVADAVLCDPVVWLSFMAGITRTLRLATGIMILPQRNPAIVAKEWATLDRGVAPDRSTMKGAWWLPGKNTCRAATLGHGT